MTTSFIRQEDTRDIIYGMNEWMKEKKEVVLRFFSSYGKVSLVLLLVVTLSILVSILVHLTVPKKLQVSFLDVGQGDSILIQTPSGHDMLIDGGVSNRVLERLSSRMSYFDRDIDVVVATHADADHVTGLIPVLEKYKVTHVITSPLKGDTGVFDELEKYIQDEGGEVHVAESGDEVDFGDGVVARVLYPEKNFIPRGRDTNDASVVLLITYGSESVLLTGDLSSEYESKLVGSNLPRHVTIYKAGHHGSKYSSGEQLLSYIKPTYAVISAGKDNRYGHPNNEMIERLETYSEMILSTIDRGTITFLLDGKKVEVKTSK